MIALAGDRRIPLGVQGRLASTRRVRQTAQVLGAIIIVVALLVVLPVAFIVTGGVFSVVLGHSLRKEGEYRHEGSELLDLNV
ncbi:MAG: hypothetical protein ACKOYM_08615 [Actinomycetes bacterium]